MWNRTMIHTPRSHRGVTMPWRDSHLYLLCLESSYASTAWPSPCCRKPGTKPGGGMLLTLSQTLTTKLICLFCVIRVPHTSCWGLPEVKKKTGKNIYSQFYRQSKALKVDIGPFSIRSIFRTLLAIVTIAFSEHIFSEILLVQGKHIFF